jgi:hypothetical protein
MPRHNDWWSAFDVVKPWGTQWVALTRALAKLEDLREEVLGCLTPEGAMRERGATASREGKIDLLLIHMESLGLDLGEVRRSVQD